ncbi:MAG: hypothetical protein J5811_06200 [Lachnospiraceae bacterium]|nr:hypothetical protein [Lachnospiraceae bacterium]
MKISSLLSDGLVLQRNEENKIWGTEAIGKVTVKVTKDNKEIVLKEAVSDDTGSFEALIPPLEAGGPIEIEIWDEKDKKTIKDVMVGDVFLLAGQSNMEIPVRRTLDLTREYSSKINNFEIRHFEVPKEFDFHGPVSDIYGGTWKHANQENVYDFSAIGYFFAEMVNRDESVPVGLIQTAVGGIQIEALIPEEKLSKIIPKLKDNAIARGESKEKTCRCGKNHYCKFCIEERIEKDKDDEWVKNTLKTEEENTAEALKKMDETDEGLKENFKDKTTLFFDGSKPQYINVPGRWENLSENAFLEDFRGTIWTLKNFEVPDEMVGKEARLKLGTIIDADETYLNGTLIGRTEYRYPPRRYDVPAGLLKKNNTLVVRIKAIDRAGGFVEEMPYFLEHGDIKIPLDRSWEFRIGSNCNPEYKKKASVAPDGTFFMFRPCGMYNKMIYPLRRMKLKGMLFYQGESNTMFYNEYDSLMKLLASSVRECFDDPGLKMAFVELPFYGQEDDERGTDNWDNLRFAQERAAKEIPDSVLVDIYDLGFKYELHPQNKMDVAKRVYDAFKKLAY